MPAPAPNNSAVWRFVDRTVVGTPDQVAAVLRSTVDSGMLVAATAPRPVVNAPHLVMVRVRLHPPASAGSPSTRVGSARPVAARAVVPATVRRWRRRAVVVAVLSLLTFGVLAAVAYLVWLAVRALISALPILAGAALVLAVLWAVLGRAGVCCPGMHCPGCRHG